MNMGESHQPGRHRAFTLIELLVVIGIISMLISILTPSLSKARQQAKATVCMATLNELMKGLVAYGGDYGFQLPPVRFEVEPKSGVYHGWAEALYQALYDDDDYDKRLNFPVMNNHADLYRLWTCREAAPAADSTGAFRAYELAWRRGGLDGVPHRVPLLTDANPLVTDPDDLLRADIPVDRVAGLEGEAYVDERHYGGANFAFRDGHVERSVSLRERLAEDWDLDSDTENR
jgi:prepilin-type N-terminal cleavage/methylation domain-containing protein/prepilin-type processing-associated H-X9-DG protein